MRKKKRHRIISVIFLVISIINWMILYLAGLFIGIIYCFHIITRTIRIEGLENIKPNKRGLIIACNHPSLFITGLTVFFLFPIFLMKPWLIPRVTPKNKWYRKWWFALLRTMSIQFDETDGREFKRAASATRFIRALNKGRVIIIFPESTRTSRAEDMGRVMLYSKKGKKIGTLEEGAAFIAIVSGALIVPVWSDEEYGRLPMPWHFPIRIRIGKPLSFKRGTSPEEATQQLTKALLELADQ